MLAGPKWPIVGRRLTIKPFERLCDSKEKNSLLRVRTGEGHGVQISLTSTQVGVRSPGLPVLIPLWDPARGPAFSFQTAALPGEASWLEKQAGFRGHR